MQKTNLLYLLVSLGASIPVAMPTVANPTSGQCITWAEYSSKLPPQGGRGGQWKTFGNLPEKFQNGCVLLDNGNAIDTAYVFQQGMSISRYAIQRTSSIQNVPSFSYEQEKDLEQLVSRGNALKVTWLTPTNGALPYLRSIPRGRAFLRDDGMTCFSTICMKSGAVSHGELAKILGNRKAK